MNPVDKAQRTVKLQRRKGESRVVIVTGGGVGAIEEKRKLMKRRGQELTERKSSRKYLREPEL